MALKVRKLEVKEGFQEIRARGYFKVSVVLGSRAFRRCFALDRDKISSNGGDNAESKFVDGEAAIASDEGESRHFRDEHPRSESP